MATIRTARKSLTPAGQFLTSFINRDRATRARFRVDQAPRKVLDPETSKHYWTPQRFGVKFGPEPFRSQLKAINPKLDVTWHPTLERWLIWVQKPSVTRTNGWSLLLFWEHPHTHEYVPLNELVFYNLALRAAHLYPNATAYVDRIEGQLAREAESRARAHGTQRQAFSRDYFEYTKIKNIGRGNKFTNHHQDGLPSKAEADWRRQTIMDRLPPEIRRAARRNREEMLANVVEAELRGNRVDG